MTSIPVIGTWRIEWKSTEYRISVSTDRNLSWLSVHRHENESRDSYTGWYYSFISFFLRRSYEVIVQEVDPTTPVRRRKRQNDNDNVLPTNLTGYVQGSKMYITADIQKERVPARFKVGDGKTYNGYVNQQLKSKTKYKIYTRATAKGKKVRESLYTSWSHSWWFLCLRECVLYIVWLFKQRSHALNLLLPLDFTI